MLLNYALRGTLVLAGLRLRRLTNIVYATRLWGRDKRKVDHGVADNAGTLTSPMGTKKANAKNNAKRTAAPRRAGVGWLVMLSVTGLMALSFSKSVRAFLLMLHCQDDATCAAIPPSLAGKFAGMLHAAAFNDLMMRGMAMLISLLWLFSVLYPFALAVRAGPDWDFEWIATLPMTRTMQLCARIVERTIVNPTPWFAFAVLGSMVAWYANAGWLSLPCALLIAAPLTLLAAAAWTVLDLGLHTALAPATLRNFQAVLGLALAPVIYLMISLDTPSGSHYALILAQGMPGWAIWTPPGVAMQVLRAPFSLNALGLYGLLWAEAAVVTLACIAFLRFQLRKGLVVHGARESGRGLRQRHASKVQAEGSRRSWLSPIKQRELTLLLRDRRYLVQCFGLPLIMVMGQFLINEQVAAHFIRDSSVVATAAFGIGAYTLTLSTLSMLATEGDKLWLLYTFPRSIGSVLREKATFYTYIALPYPLLMLAYWLAVSPAASWHQVIEFALALLGLPIYAIIATALGVLSGLSSGLSPGMPSGSQQRQPGVRYVYLFMLLAGFYAYALLTHAWWPHLAIPFLCGALAFALWQKASDRMPYLLDASAAPAARVSLADGLIATTLFFVLQFMAMSVLKGVVPGDITARIVLAYICAGAITYLLMSAAFWTLKTREVPKMLGSNIAVGVALGAGVGLFCAAAGLLYLWLARHYGFEPKLTHARILTPAARLAIVALSVCAAPLFEEFVFRGLIFGGLRRSLGFSLAALGSAVLFAIVHPPFSMLPVFVLGLGTAWVYERRKMLLASMVTHAVYNAVVVGYPLIMLNS
ncbi:CPBP family intramembrane glutamic endopeptidase [Paraburkholderia sp. DHOC27]|uniref:CPBP family intramembrane glutamic endopeptidase n=1 Tax=Paraburkholderia sp. DHOC27 TaxID=2303330 RepID=UPI000E3EC539|nr:type II CAAX endopeptidase family protein [Paraburkholderia sp. DHOC27]RFU48581.1 CPBP family intramembrane metalloprotease [Paraburkholderia sp. DHOC27]